MWVRVRVRVRVSVRVRAMVRVRLTLTLTPIRWSNQGSTGAPGIVGKSV